MRLRGVEPVIKRLICRIIGHRSIKTITGLKLRDFSWTYRSLRGEITSSRIDCLRCGREGLTPADRRSPGSVW